MMAEANPVREGFLCPICHKDLRSPQNLIAHFQDIHSEEQDILKSIKGKPLNINVFVCSINKKTY